MEGAIPPFPGLCSQQRSLVGFSVGLWLWISAVMVKQRSRTLKTYLQRQWQSAICVLSLCQTLLNVKDVGNVVEAMYGDLPPPIMLIGHSMGGAIAVHTASSTLVPSLLGLCMIDVVEGTAMDALNSMQNFLRGRPKTFKSLENAIEWSVKSGQIRNLESARVSMVGQVKQCEGITSPEGSKSIVEGIIEEEEEEEEGSESVNKRKKEDDMETKKDHPYTWRIELAKTEKYWDGWFRGLSNLFLSCPIPKLLLLAGVDRLDKDLTIGQMQGKFQMQVLPQCGHAVHEDAPDKVAEAVATFLIRHRFAEPIGGFQCVFPGC
ncbi:protein phosphatase methylesterase 1 isoform X2 [Tenrec ecaudatus]|uniref:protein phosphatase methylesterase 1 isoform X2 n=1 Tax=Tenrec ecaudatus TaxID=94439 RepID=UPI003F592FF1